MKNMYKMMLLAVGLLMGTANLNAQNRYSFGDGETRSTTIVASDNIEVTQIDDNMIQCSTVNKLMTDIRENAVTHTLTINMERNRAKPSIYIAGENYYNRVTAYSFSEEVEEGFYDILVSGRYYDENDMQCYGFIAYDSVAVFDDVTINASYDECIYTIGIDAVDENGQPLSLKDYVVTDYNISFRWLGGSKWIEPWNIQNLLTGSTFLSEITTLRYNGFDERSFVLVNANLYTTEQVNYNITFPIIGLSDNIVLTNDASDLINYKVSFALNEGDLALNKDSKYYSINSIVRFDENTFTGIWTYDEHLSLDANKLITIYSNNKVANLHDYTYDAKPLLLPTIFESRVNYNISPVYENSVVALGLYHNADNQIVHESFGMPKNIMYSEGAIPLNYLGYFQETPATIISNPEDLIVIEGRTPLSYYQAYAIKASESLSGKNTFIPSVFSIGDNACDRVGDNCARAFVTYNGEEIFNDSLYKWINGMEYQNELPGEVTIDINNKHLIVAGVEKNNRTHIEFDFNREDVTAPTMTILQVKDENGKESIDIPQLPSSNIYFAAGDFSPHWTDEGPYGGHYDYMQYDGKPNIEVFCSLEEEGEIYWMHLFFEEDQTMFHENYGNFFNIPLVQLAGMYNNEWVSLKFILTDDAGNKMEQELYNVFYVGHWDAVEEQSSLNHNVYPNPFTNEVRITAAQAVNGIANIQVYNVLGERVYSKTENCADTKEFSIDGNAWKSGVYFYSISTENGVLQGKIVKE